MGIFVSRATLCSICSKTIEHLGGAVAFPLFDGPEVAWLSDGFAHRSCLAECLALDGIRSAWSGHWAEQARVFDSGAVVSDRAVGFRKRARFVLVDSVYFTVIEEMMSGRSRFCSLLDTEPVGERHDLPLNSYVVTRTDREVRFVVMTQARRSLADEANTTVVEDVVLVDLQFGLAEWQEFAATLRKHLPGDS